MINRRVCKQCRESLDYSEFDQNSKGIPNRNICKSCRRDRRTKMDKRSGDGLRSYRMYYQYGLTLEQYDQMNKDQNGLCKLCNRESKNFWGTKLAVDHCHITGKVRGLLCDKCNKGLGQFEDNIEVLQKAIEYLKKT